MKIIVSEKNSVSTLIKNVLKDETYSYLPVSGHIVVLDYKDSKKLPWSKVPLHKLVEEDLEYCYKEDWATKNLKTINSGEEIEELILALDPDVEGHFIANCVVAYLEAKNIKLKQINSVFLEDLSKKGILEAFEKKKIYSPVAGFPGDLRMRLDFLFGTILTRKASLDCLKTNKNWVTYKTGRVQTPTLNELVFRQKEINEFKPTKYYSLKAPKTKYTGAIDLEDLESLLDSQNLKIKSIKLTKTSEKIIEPKKGLNTDDLLKKLSEDHAVFRKITPATTKLLEDLYLKGIISYPRVENKEYNNHPQTLNDFAILYEQKENLKAVIPDLKPNKTITDHAPITPLVLEKDSYLDTENKVLKSLFNHAKKIFSGPNTYCVYHYDLITNNKTYKFTINVALNRNYDDGLKYIKDFIPEDFAVQLKDQLLQMEEKVTKPKSRYNGVSLLKEMTKKNLGTKSTKIQIIQNLIDNGYLYAVKEGFKPSLKAFRVIEYWKKQFLKIVDFKLTAEIEDQFKKLETKDKLEEIEKLYRAMLKEHI